MIIGKVEPGEKKVRIQTDISCTSCHVKVPGGIQTSEKYSKTDSFYKELEKFKNKYLCGRCRDKKRVESS